MFQVNFNDPGIETRQGYLKKSEKARAVKAECTGRRGRERWEASSHSHGVGTGVYSKKSRHCHGRVSYMHEWSDTCFKRITGYLKPIAFSILGTRKFKRTGGCAVWEAKLGGQVWVRSCRAVCQVIGNFCNPFMLMSIN